MGVVGVNRDSSRKDEFCAITDILGTNFSSERGVPGEKWRASLLFGLAD